MLGWTRSVVPDSRFVVGRAEALPVAGSLHYVDLGKFFPEASRVLGAEGELVVYDFSPQVNEWFGAFMTRYPTPPFSGRILTPDLLAPLAPGFRPIGPEWYEESLPLDHSFYVDYAMTEANVAAAVRAGVDEEASRELRHATIVSVSGA